MARVAAERVGTTGHVVGADISQPMLSVARSKPYTTSMAHIEYLESPATELRVSDAVFDVVLCQQGLQFFPDRRLALTKMLARPKTGRQVGNSCLGSPPPLTAAPRQALTECGVAVPEPSGFGADPQDLPRALTDAGFDVRRAEDVTLTVTYEGGMDEVLEHIPATPIGESLAALPEARYGEFRQLLAAKLQPWTKAGAVIMPTVARVAVAVKSV